MAVRASQRRSLGKRCDYVSNESTMDEFSSSDDESISKMRRKNKVRSVKSIRRLFVDSCTYEKSDEHGYTQAEARGCKRIRRDTESDFYENTVSKKQRCVNRNAINARLNREKKKAYLASLEEEIHHLREVNQKSEWKLKEQDTAIGKMKQELLHMKSLLANNKYLNSLVSKLSEVTGLPVTSSLIGKIKEEEPARTRSVPHGVNHPVCNNDVSLGGRDMYGPLSSQCESLSDFTFLEDNYFVDYDLKELFPDFSDCGESEKSLGICVHINQNRLSVEFCPVCNSRAGSV